MELATVSFLFYTGGVRSDDERSTPPSETR
jgi:hypothetical protein